MVFKQKYSLGEAVPDSPHSVVSNLPTLADVCAYEEKATYVAEAMGAGLSAFCRAPLGSSSEGTHGCRFGRARSVGCCRAEINAAFKG